VESPFRLPGVPTLSNSINHGIEFIRTEAKKETGNTNEIMRVLLRSALR
jgi:hypothetical protein